MPMLGQDPNARFKVRPRTVTKRPEDDPQMPTAKVPEKVTVPVPVPVPTPVSVSPAGLQSQRYRVAPPQGDVMTGIQRTPAASPGIQPDYAKKAATGMSATMPPPTDTATAPGAGAEDALVNEVPSWLKNLHDAEAQKAADEAAPVKKDKWWKAGLKMLAYGAKDMPPAHDWNEFAYGAGRALGSGAAGLVKHDLPGQIEKRYRVAADEARVEQAQKTANIESIIQSKNDAQKVRNARLNRDLSKDEIAKVQNERKSVAADLRRLPYIDPSNPVHAKILARAKANGIDVDPESFGKGKARQRITVLDDDGVTKHIFERDPQKGWVPISIEGKDAVAGLTDKRNPLTGETYTSEQRRAFEKQKFDFTKLEAQIHDNQRERALGLQKQGMDIRVAQGQAEVEAIDNVLPDLETQLNTTDDEAIRSQIQRAITTLKDRRGRAAGAGGVAAIGEKTGKTYLYTEDEVRKRAAHLGPVGIEAALTEARKRGWIPPK